MNNIMPFPRPVWEPSPDTESENVVPGGQDDQDGQEEKAGLLSTLSFLRDCLNGDDAALPSETRRRCIQAIETALDTAISMERTLLNQTLHIEQMAKIICTDPLTGVSNRRGFTREFQRVLSAATRYNETGVLIYVDLDGFKPVNDTYGHAAGDEMLIEVARVLRESIRPQDMVARLGGDEFAVLLTRTDWASGLNHVERIKHTLNTHYIHWNDKHIAVRASFGFQRFGANANPESLLHKADCAMFEAKRLRGEHR